MMHAQPDMHHSHIRGKCDHCLVEYRAPSQHLASLKPVKTPALNPLSAIEGKFNGSAVQ
jgi:hypothetical protein